MSSQANPPERDHIMRYTKGEACITIRIPAAKDWAAAMDAGIEKIQGPTAEDPAEERRFRAIVKQQAIDRKAGK